MLQYPIKYHNFHEFLKMPVYKYEFLQVIFKFWIKTHTFISEILKMSAIQNLKISIENFEIVENSYNLLENFEISVS